MQKKVCGSRQYMGVPAHVWVERERKREKAYVAKY